MNNRCYDMLTTLSGGRTKDVVWAEMGISSVLKKQLADEIPDGLTFEEYFGIANYVCGGICPPGIVEYGTTNSGKTVIKKGLLRTRSDLRRIKEVFPDPKDNFLYEPVHRKLEKAPKNLAKCVITDLGAGAALVSMGIDGFAYALADDLLFVKEVFLRYAEWSAQVHKHLCGMGFDFIWSGGDIAFGSGPFFSPEVFHDVLLPAMHISADVISLPWVYHSDGNLMPILDDLLSLGMNGLHPFEPGTMDIKLYGSRMCVIGNISVDLLSRGRPSEVELETKKIIGEMHPLGGYIISSSNILTDYVKPENFLAMSRSIKNCHLPLV